MAGGLRAAGPKADIALVVADEPCVAAGVFTLNVMCAAPVTYCKQVLVKGQPVKAVSRVFQTAKGRKLFAALPGTTHCWGQRGLKKPNESRHPCPLESVPGAGIADCPAFAQHFRTTIPHLELCLFKRPLLTCQCLVWAWWTTPQTSNAHQDQAEPWMHLEGLGPTQDEPA